MEPIALTTSDGKKLAALYGKGETGQGVLLLHMMPATKESWENFSQALLARGYHVLALDFRGHGESEGGPEGYKNFSDTEHQAKMHDVEAGAAFLEKQGISEENLIVVGASIGANLALRYLAEHPRACAVVLLSGGLTYKGVNAEEDVQRLHPGQRVFFVTSEDDRVSGNADMNRSLHVLVPEGIRKKLLVYGHAGHGTDMFNKEEPDLQKEIVEWIQVS